MKKSLVIASLLLPLGCRTNSPAAEPWPYPDSTDSISGGESVTLHIDPDGSIQALGRVVYDPTIDNEAEFKSFMAAQREKDPNLTVNLLSAPGVSMDGIERAAKLVGDDSLNRGAWTFRVSGSVQSSIHVH